MAKSMNSEQSSPNPFKIMGTLTVTTLDRSEKKNLKVFYLSYYWMMDLRCMFWISIRFKLSCYWWNMLEEQKFALWLQPSQCETPVPSLYPTLNVVPDLVQPWEPCGFWAAVEDFPFIYDLYTNMQHWCLRCASGGGLSLDQLSQSVCCWRRLIARIIICLESVVGLGIWEGTEPRGEGSRWSQESSLW